MEAPALYQRFKENLETMVMLLDRVDIRTTPYQTTIPLEVSLFCEIIGKAGVELHPKTEGLLAIHELQKAFREKEKAVMDAMAKLLQDKRSWMKTPEGKILLKELLIRRLEYFNETARTMAVMANQTTLKSPIQHIHPHHREDIIHPRLK